MRAAMHPINEEHESLWASTLQAEIERCVPAEGATESGLRATALRSAAICGALLDLTSAAVLTYVVHAEAFGEDPAEAVSQYLDALRECIDERMERANSGGGE